MDKVVQEGNLQFDFSKSKSVWKIEKEISPTISHCMKCVEFIVRWPGEIWLIEVKDPENPNIPEKYSDEKYKNFVDSLKRNTLFDHELGPKAKDTFLYLYLNNELGGEPLRYLVLLGLDSFKDSYISSLPDYAYLFERFYYYLEDKASEPMGVVVFDELEKSRCHLLVNQMEEYFLKTTKGRMRSSRIVPEPFFVHSDLTTAIQLADLVAYITSWGVQVGNMEAPARKELKPLAEKVCQLRYKALRTINDQDDFTVWSFAVFDDLRPKEEA